jgi:hypothetical protein
MLLIKELEVLASKPLRKIQELDFRVAMFQARRNTGYGYISKCDVSVKVNNKLFTLRETETRNFPTGYGGKHSQGSVLIKAHLAEVDLYARKSYIYSPFIWVAYQLSIVRSLGGFSLVYELPQVVDENWHPIPFEQDLLFGSLQEYNSKSSGSGSAAYFGGIWEDAD